jgi:maleylpyruvate isomerase
VAVDNAEVLNAVRIGQDRLRRLADGLTEDQVRDASALPGWSRAHVLAHLANVATALVRQTDYALRDELAEFYDGGRPVRDAGIEEGSRQSAAQLITSLDQAYARLDERWAALTPQDWARRITYRDGTLRTTLLAQWREVEIHTTDLLLGYTSDEWTAAFCAHLTDFLGSRKPHDVELVGAPTDVVAWLAGREPIGPVTTKDGAELPALGTWP